MNISLTILVVFDTFSIKAGIISLFHYIRNLIYSQKHLTSMTVLKHDDVIKTVT